MIVMQATPDEFDGVNWKCEKCNNAFNLFEVTNFKCPKCGKQVKVRDITRKPLKKKCAFQAYHITKDYHGIACELTAWALASEKLIGVFTGIVETYKEINKQPCRIEICPIYQTWKATTKVDVE